ncbi:PREDICTED: histone H1B-like [Vollenhovia emeryi]|uniref:histone H1B-like n=1 Tax=Vollenhovia emeryi TaxID=411798 RepID=UPI0005F53855|nr:PREDICTED: histone H1B-like [Vollenhovia emeryi]
MEDKVSGNAAVEGAESNTASAKKASKSKAKSQQQQKKVSSRPPTSEMVKAAIKELKDRKGSSFQAIKKYIVSTYKVDGEKVAPFIKRYLKTAVSAGAVVQTKGKGATGSFKLSTNDKPSKPKPKGKAQRASAHSDTKKDTKVEKAATRKPAAAKKPAKKVVESPKKQSAQKAVAKTAAKKGRAAAEPKSPSKAKKAVKAPAAKTKTPKPKKATAKTVKAAAKK